jgi:hypothetical protein
LMVFAFKHHQLEISPLRFQNTLYFFGLTQRNNFINVALKKKPGPLYLPCVKKRTVFIVYLLFFFFCSSFLEDQSVEVMRLKLMRVLGQ